MRMLETAEVFTLWGFCRQQSGGESKLFVLESGGSGWGTVSTELAAEAVELDEIARL